MDEPTGDIPLFGDVIVDAAGRLWFQDYRHSGAIAPRDGRAWTIVEGDGRPLARLTEDREFDIRDIGADHVLVTVTDELGVQRVEVYPIVRP